MEVPKKHGHWQSTLGFGKPPHIKILQYQSVLNDPKPYGCGRMCRMQQTLNHLNPL